MALGMLIGASSADRIVSRLGTTWVIVMGFIGTAIAGALAAFWQVETAYWQLGLIFFWIAFFLGYIAAPATDAVMGALSEAKAGIGSAMNTVSRMVAGAIGVAVIGSVLSTVYSSSFGKAVAAIPNLPAELVSAASDSVGAAVTIAQQLPAPFNEMLAQLAKESFMDGWQVMAFVTCGMSIVGAIVILRFMPPRHEATLKS
jgi:DHA2 family multidrug resistance protein-like MFS transporter